MKIQKIEGSKVLVTGANRGIGRALVEAFLDRGAAKVYAAARRPETLRELTESFPDRVVPVALDVTDPAQVMAASQLAADVEILVNNAGVALGGWLGDASLEDNARREMEVNYFAPLRLLDSFAPVLERAGGGTVVNVASVAGLTSFPVFPTYSASKAAVHSLTQGSRMLLAARGIRVSGVYPGPVDTDLARGIDMDKASTAEVAARIVAGVEAGEEDIFTDPFAQGFADVFLASPKGSEQQFAAMAAGEA